MLVLWQILNLCYRFIGDVSDFIGLFLHIDTFAKSKKKKKHGVSVVEVGSNQAGLQKVKSNFPFKSVFLSQTLEQGINSITRATNLPTFQLKAQATKLHFHSN